MKKELLRSLPKTDELLRNKNLEEYGKNLDYYTFSNSVKLRGLLSNAEGKRNP